MGINDDEFQRPNDVFRPSPFREQGGSGWDPFLTGVDYTNPTPDNPEPEGFLAEGSVDGAVHIIPGSIPPTAVDTTPPAVPTGLTLATGLNQQADGALVPYLRVSWNAVGDADIHAYEVEVDRGASPTWTNPKTYRTSGTSITIEDVQGATVYSARVRAVDTFGNRSAFTAAANTTIVGDTIAPDMVTGLTAVPGFRLVGLVWTRSTATDLARYEVRYAPDDGTGDPDTALWSRVSVNANSTVISGLEPDVPYFFQARAIDRSGNVRTSAGVATAVQAESNLDAGWSNLGPADYVSATPTLVGAADVAFNSVLTSILTSNSIDAGDIKTGTLSVGGLANVPDFILVYNTLGQEIGRWDENGLFVKDPVDANRQIRLVNGVISFSSDAGVTWTTAIGPDGIIADSIRLGTAPGGHNAVPNSSFELSGFAVLLAKVWTAAGDWGTATSTVNVTTSGADLVMTTAGY